MKHLKLNSGLIFISILFFYSAPKLCFAQNEVTQEIKKEVILEVCTLLKEHYVYPDIAAIICDTLQKSLKYGRYDDAINWDIFTDKLNEVFRRVTNDQHLESWITARNYKSEPNINDIISSSFGFIYRNKNTNFGIPKVELLEGNVGYVEFTSFKPLPNSETERIVRSAMDFLSNCDALIIDLRNNGGGHTNMREFICSYFFNGPVQLSSTYSRETRSNYESYTIKDFYNQKLVDVPLYILTSKKTISAPEIFAYDLQALKRAVIVGEVTAGSVNSGRIFTIKNSINLVIATGYTMNPITQTNCEGRGVQPDVEVSSENALGKAMELAKVAAQEYREKKERMVDKHVEKFCLQLQEVEEQVDKDIVQAEEKLSSIIQHFYDIEFMTPYILLDLGDWYLKKDQVYIAIFILKQGLVYYSGLMEMYIFYKYLAEAYLKIDDKKNAIKYYLEYLELFPYDIETLKKLNDIIEKQ